MRPWILQLEKVRRWTPHRCWGWFSSSWSTMYWLNFTHIRANLNRLWPSSCLLDLVTCLCHRVKHWLSKVAWNDHVPIQFCRNVGVLKHWDKWLCLVQSLCQLFRQNDNPFAKGPVMSPDSTPGRVQLYWVWCKIVLQLTWFLWVELNAEGLWWKTVLAN